MALKTIMLRRSIEKKTEELNALRAKDIEFKTREEDLEKAIDEAGTLEEEEAVTQEVEAFDNEKVEHEANKAKIQSEIEDLESQLDAAERKAPEPHNIENNKPKERTDMHMENIKIRSLPLGQRAFDALPMEQRAAIVERSEVKEFLTRLRGMKGQTRDVTGAELTIPVVFLELIAENMFRYSKLMNRVR